MVMKERNINAYYHSTSMDILVKSAGMMTDYCPEVKLHCTYNIWLFLPQPLNSCHKYSTTKEKANAYVLNF